MLLIPSAEKVSEKGMESNFFLSSKLGEYASEASACNYSSYCVKRRFYSSSLKFMVCKFETTKLSAPSLSLTLTRPPERISVCLMRELSRCYTRLRPKDFLLKRVHDCYESWRFYFLDELEEAECILLSTRKPTEVVDGFFKYRSNMSS